MTVPTQISAITRCPHCSAKFRVRPEQVKLHAGLVRCGACRGIFDAVEHLIEGTLPSVDPIDDHGEVTPPQTIVQGMPAMTQAAEAPARREGAAPQRREVSTPDARDAPQVGAIAPQWKASAGAESKITQGHTAPITSAGGESIEIRNVDVGERQSDPTQPAAMDSYRWRPQPQVNSPAMRWVYALLCLIGVLGLAAQAAYFFRDEIAIRVPQMAPSLATACTYLDCRLQPPKRGESLGFVGTDLAADPAHKGLLIFTATLRNSGATAVAYPHLVLSLDGLGGEMVVRRVFTPAEFAPATASLVRGLEAGAEIEVKLYLDASQTNVLGFKVDHAYL
jgi:predicted Zn finger-like uncharacterized protein